MPKYWEKFSENRAKIDDSDEKIAKKELNMRICAEKYPYFFQYRYLSMKRSYDAYKKAEDGRALGLYGKTVKEMKKELNKTKDEQRFLDDYDKYCPMDESCGVQNRICWAVEDDINDYKMQKISGISCLSLASGQKINNGILLQVESLCRDFEAEITKQTQQYFKTDQKDETQQSIAELMRFYIEDMYRICPDEEELCDILIELCYNHGYAKELLWQSCDVVILRRLMNVSTRVITYPQVVKDDQTKSQFICQGRRYITKTIEEGEIDE